MTVDAEFSKFDKNKEYSDIGTELIDASKKVGIIECLFPPHEESTRDKLFKKALYALPLDSSG
jgi:hypothetical protein